MQPSIEVAWMGDPTKDQKKNKAFKESIDEPPSTLTRTSESREEENKASIIRECEEFLQKFSQRQDLLDIRPLVARKHASIKYELSLRRKEFAGAQSRRECNQIEMSKPEREPHISQNALVERNRKAAASLMSESKCSSSQKGRPLFKSLKKSSRQLSMCKHQGSETSDDRGRFSKINNSLFCIVGRHKEACDEDESRCDKNQARSSLLGSSTDRSDRKEVKKVAFLSDLVDYVEPDLQRVDTIESECSQEASDQETTLMLKSYEEFVGRLRRERRTFGEPDLSTRVKTNMLALVENIDNDAGLWFGLRCDSFEADQEGGSCPRQS